MADKKIGDLVAATEVKDTDLLIMEQDGTAKNMSGAQLLEYLKPKLDEAVNESIQSLHQVTGTAIERADNTVTVVTTLEDGSTSTSVITVDSNDYPTKIVTDGTECTVTWEGFDG